MGTSRHDWALYFMAPQGHRYFYCRNTYDLAVADDSGETPDKTEDGVLYLDTDRPIVNDPEDGVWYIPLKRGPDDLTTTPAGWMEVVMVACCCGSMKVLLDGKEIPVRATVNGLLPDDDY